MSRKNKKDLTIHVVLDRSGSMSSIKDDTIGGFNDYVSQIAEKAPDSRLSLTIFDSQSIDTIVDDVRITEVEPLTSATYQPRGGTPLYDAIGKVVDKLHNSDGKNKALVILTDGQENASREYSKDAIKKTITEKQEKNNWLVVYLGANQDAFEEGSRFGALTGNTLNFNSSNIRETLSAAANSTMRYGLTGSRAKATFTTEEREKAAAE